MYSDVILFTSKEKDYSLGGHGILLFLLELVVHVVHVNGMDLSPSFLGNVEQVVDSSRSGITVGGMIDGSLSEIDCLFDGQVGTVTRVQDTIG